MPRHCSICYSSDRDAIDRELVGGAPFRDIARRYRASASAVSRHRQSHLPNHLLQAQQDVVISDASALLAHLRCVEAETERLRGMAEAKGDLRTALAAVRERTRIIELKARLAQHDTELVEQARKVMRAFALAVRR